MAKPTPKVEVPLRIPGPWLGPDEFDSRLPEGYRLHGDGKELWLKLPDGSLAELDARPADEEFPGLFLNGCKKEPTDEERDGVLNYRFNACLILPGGSLAAALDVMRHSCALLDAGGHGVWIDNSGASHGASAWRELSESALAGEERGAELMAFLVTIRGDDDLYTMGMHALGGPDASVSRGGDDRDDFETLMEFLYDTLRSGVPIQDGDVYGEPEEPRFRIHIDADPLPDHSPMHNPFGRVRLERLRGRGGALRDN
jgi:hypothetical protein